MIILALCAAGGCQWVSGLVVALTILQMVSSGLNLLRVNTSLTIVTWCMILILVIAVNTLSALCREKRCRERSLVSPYRSAARLPGKSHLRPRRCNLSVSICVYYWHR